MSTRLQQLTTTAGLFAMLAGLAIASPDEIRFVTTPTQTNRAASGGSFLPTLSLDGRSLVFVSYARNLLATDEPNPCLNVFVKDLETGQLMLASIATNQAFANADASFPSISSNGLMIAFASSASNLVPGDTNQSSDVFVRDVCLGITRLVSVDLRGISPVNPQPNTNSPVSGYPLISVDGRRVLFESRATNLVALADTNRQTDVFARDLATETTLLVSVNAEGTAAAHGSSQLEGLTPDGRHVLFLSSATNLVAGITSPAAHVFVRDLQTQTTYWISSNAFSADVRCVRAALSAEGRFVAYKTQLPGAARAQLWCHDRQVGSTRLLAHAASPEFAPAISADGRYVASEEGDQVFRWDTLTGDSNLLSLSLDLTNAASGTSQAPVMTPDGNRIAFVSTATNLTSEPANGLGQIFLRDVRSNAPVLVSVNREGAASQRDHSILPPVVSADGLLVAFESGADDLVEDDRNRDSDIFIRRLDTAATTIASLLNEFLLAASGAGSSRVDRNALSADGRFAIFTSHDRALVSGDTNAWRDVHVMDLVDGTTTPVSLMARQKLGFSGAAKLPAISANGRNAVFAVHEGAPAYYTDEARSGPVIWCDLKQDSYELLQVSPLSAPLSLRNPVISSGGFLVAAIDLYSSGPTLRFFNMLMRTNFMLDVSLSGSVPGVSTQAVFSANERWVLFISTRDRITTNAVGMLPSLYARDLQTDLTYLVSHSPTGDPIWGHKGRPAIASNSRHVAFIAFNGAVTLHDLETHTSQFVAPNGYAPSVSREGRFVAYEVPGSTSNAQQIVVTDTHSASSTLVSVNRFDGTGGNRDSATPLISGDGRFVVFASKASDLVDQDTNPASDIFVRDRLLGTTLLASVNRFGTGSGNGPSTDPVMAADGRTVVFQSFASDLVPGDYNLQRDVFVLKLGGLDQDGDGLDDDWEQTYFSTLDRDGTGDFDGDGQSDAQEFRAGTDPTNLQSALRVLTLAAPGSGSTTVLWSAVPGRQYRVQFKDAVDAADWTDLPGLVTASSATGVKTDSTAGALTQRFYRVVLVP